MARDKNATIKTFFITRTEKLAQRILFNKERGSEYIKDCSRSRGLVGRGVAGGLVLEHVLHGGGNHGSVDERKVGSDPELP